MHHHTTRIYLLLLLFLGPSAAHAQFDLEDSLTTASLRGIHSLGNGLAWASGTDGTVLRTEDGGYEWQPCTTPPGAEHLDFRGIQAFDENTAIVMSSGKGDLSRLYKTTDGCRTWKLLFTNPDKDGFWDAVQFSPAEKKTGKPQFGALVGDPVAGRFPVFLTFDGGDHWEPQIKQAPAALPGEGLFAASNQSLLLEGLARRAFVTGGSSGPRILQYLIVANDTPGPDDFEANVASGGKQVIFHPRHMQADMLSARSAKSDSSGAFAIQASPPDGYTQTVVIVGGDYSHPEIAGLALHGFLGGDTDTFKLAKTPPHGYRSSVSYDPKSKTWITVGPNGTDTSTDDGKNWRPLHPGPNQPPISGQDADKNWNALSLPFVVGPHGRIGKLRDDALKP